MCERCPSEHGQRSHKRPTRRMRNQVRRRSRRSKDLRYGGPLAPSSTQHAHHPPSGLLARPFGQRHRSCALTQAAIMIASENGIRHGVVCPGSVRGRHTTLG